VIVQAPLLLKSDHLIVVRGLGSAVDAICYVLHFAYERRVLVVDVTPEVCSWLTIRVLVLVLSIFLF